MSNEQGGSSTGTKVLWGILIALAAILVLIAAFLIGTAFAGGDSSQSGGESAPPTAGAEYLPVPTAIPGQPALMSLAYLNVRQGPGTENASYGLMQPGQSAQVVGKNADATWWQINFPSGAGGVGWCSAEYVATQNTQDVPVVE